VPLEGGKPLKVCESCSIGFGSVRTLAPLISWSVDGKWVYVPLRYFPFGSSKTAAIPIKAGALPVFTNNTIASEAEFVRTYGAHIIDHDNIGAGISADRFVYTQRSAKANLFRIYLEPSH